MKVLFVILAILIGVILFILIYEPDPDSYEISRKWYTEELPESDFNLEVYYLEGMWGGGFGAYGSGDMAVFKAYKDGGYDRIYRTEYRGDANYKFERISKDKILLIVSREILEYYRTIDTLPSGNIHYKSGNKLVGYEYDTVEVDLD